MNAMSSTMANVGEVTRCRVVAVFHDAAAQHRAMRVCDSMMARFCTDLEFEVEWCSFEQFADSHKAREITECTAQANVVIISTAAHIGLPGVVRSWIRNWSELRHGREGTLIGLVDGVAETRDHAIVQQELRNAAHRAGLDYMTHEPDTHPVPMTDDPKWLNAKCHELGSVLGGMLEQSLRSPSEV
jgi:hypothetical protein